MRYFFFAICLGLPAAEPKRSLLFPIFLGCLQEFTVLITLPLQSLILPHLPVHDPATFSSPSFLEHILFGRDLKGNQRKQGKLFSCKSTEHALSTSPIELNLRAIVKRMTMHQRCLQRQTSKAYQQKSPCGLTT